MDRVFSFLLWPNREVRGLLKQGRKERGSITCRADRANEANKMFIIWLCWLFRFWKGDQELEVRTATYGPGVDQSQHAKSVSHIIKINIKASSKTTIKFIQYLSLRLPFTLSGVFSFSYVTSLIHMGNPQPIYQWKAYDIIYMMVKSLFKYFCL